MSSKVTESHYHTGNMNPKNYLWKKMKKTALSPDLLFAVLDKQTKQALPEQPKQKVGTRKPKSDNRVGKKKTKT